MVSRKSRKRDADIGRSTSYVLHAIVSLFKYLVSFTRKSYAVMHFIYAYYHNYLEDGMAHCTRWPKVEAQGRSQRGWYSNATAS